MATKYVCPRCHSENIMPLFAKDGIWVCNDCGYKGKPIELPDKLLSFWKDWKSLEAEITH